MFTPERMKKLVYSFFSDLSWKCILVCANCHREIETGLIDMGLWRNGSSHDS